MTRRTLVLIVVLLMSIALGNGFVGASENPNDTYLYKDVCPTPSGGAMHADKWSFYKCECTSYVAHKLNENGVAFNNSYKLPAGAYWHGAGHWKSAADSVGIETGNIPYPGDVAWWSGHVAYVERVDYDDNGQWVKVYISEYNYNPSHDYNDTRTFTPVSNNRPQAYLHINPIKYRHVSASNDYDSVSIFWLPANVPCNKASVWSYNGTCSAQNNHPSICQTAYDELKDIDPWTYSGSNWETIFFGSIHDFQNLCH